MDLKRGYWVYVIAFQQDAQRWKSDTDTIYLTRTAANAAAREMGSGVKVVRDEYAPEVYASAKVVS